MKKVLCLACLFFMLCSVAWADNINQANFEKKVIFELVNSNPAFNSLSKQQIFENEINVFNDNGDSVIGLLYNQKNEYETSKQTKNINYEYICKMLDNFQRAFYTRKVSSLKPIYIDDTIYNSIDDVTKFILAWQNWLAGAIIL